MEIFNPQKEKIYVQYQNGIPITVNTYIAEYGFKKMGFETIPFTREEIMQLGLHQLSAMKNDIFIGGCQTLLDIIKALGLKLPISYKPHVYLPMYCGRKISDTTLGDFKKMVILSNYDIDPCFIKPADDTKLFDGFVYRTEIDLIKLNNFADELPILISELIDIKSEFRCFVHRGRLIDVKNYNGDFRVAPNYHIIDSAIKDFAEQPISYTLDFAVCDNGKMKLIEINDGFALGYCGIHPVSYCKLLFDRWKQIMTNTVYRT